MATIYDVQANEVLIEAATELKKIEQIKPPEWAGFVKTGMHKERPPVDKDWWYMRTAAVLRKIATRGPIGVEKLRKHYGGRKNRGVRPEKFFKGSGNILRTVLQQLESAELARQTQKGLHKGRIATAKGIKLLDNAATRAAKK
jgi:small subunit ribosomal protein S19e